MIQFKRAKTYEHDKPGEIFINPVHVVVIVPRADVGYGPQCEIGMVNATAWLVQHSAEQVGETINLLYPKRGVR